jgi:hypothetical protein
MISGPLIRKKNAPVSLATALAIRVFPEPVEVGVLRLKVFQKGESFLLLLVRG